MCVLLLLPPWAKDPVGNGFYPLQVDMELITSSHAGFVSYPVPFPYLGSGAVSICLRIMFGLWLCGTLTHNPGGYQSLGHQPL
jgi:hypothetical protein